MKPFFTQRIATLACVALFAAIGPAARAQCSSMSPKTAIAWQNVAPAAPALTMTVPQPAVDAPASDPSLVGLWNVTFFSGGQVVDQAFEVFHSDNTEMMVDTAPPASDNVCVGVWAGTSRLTYKLNHPSWTFDDQGNLNGTATIKVNLALSPAGTTFAGTFTVDVFDLHGNNLEHLTGTVSAKRITAN
jgi:hypothetical protein